MLARKPTAAYVESLQGGVAPFAQPHACRKLKEAGFSEGITTSAKVFEELVVHGRVDAATLFPATPFFSFLLGLSFGSAADISN